MVAAMPGERDYDVALFGATGFTGGLTADYLAANAPTACAGRWSGVTGRSSRPSPPASPPPAPRRPRRPCSRPTPPTRRRSRRSPSRPSVVITTVGPYALYGAPLVAACAAAGTDYVDLTGEPEFVDRMYLENHADGRAQRRPHRPLLRFRLGPA